MNPAFLCMNFDLAMGILPTLGKSNQVEECWFGNTVVNGRNKRLR